MQIELLNRKKWMTHVELAAGMADYIVNVYNPVRRHSSLAYFTPDEFEVLPLKNDQVRTLISVDHWMRPRSCGSAHGDPAPVPSSQLPLCARTRNWHPFLTNCPGCVRRVVCMDDGRRVTSPESPMNSATE